MRRFLAVSMAALTLGTTIAATAGTPAEARSGYYDRYGRWHSYRRNNNNDAAAAAIAGGIVGLALGAALSSSNRDRYNDRYYGGGYYDNGYSGRNYYGGNNYSYYGGNNYGAYDNGYYGRRYRTCSSRRTVWDPYIGTYVTQRFRYAC